MVDETAGIVPDQPAGGTGPASPPPPRYPGLGGALLLILFIQIIANSVAAVALLGSFLIRGNLEGALRVDAPSLGILANSLAFGAVTWFAWRRSGSPARRVFPFGRVSPRQWLPMLLALAGALLVVNELSNGLLRILPVPDLVRDLVAQFLGKGKGLVDLAFLAIVAPVTEEFFFRGAVLSSFQPRYGAARAVAWSAALFALVHILPWQMVPAFCLGLLFGWWTVMTGSLWPALAAHALTNATAFFQGLSLAPEDIFTPSPQPVGLTLGGVALLAGGIAWSAALFRRRGPAAAEQFERSSP
jgi:hypothetical protein